MMTSLLPLLLVFVAGVDQPAVAESAPRAIRPGEIRSTIISPDGRVQITGEDGTALFWKTGAKEPYAEAMSARPLVRDDGRVGLIELIDGVAFGPKGRRIVLRNPGGSVQIHDVGTGNLMKQFILSGRLQQLSGIPCLGHYDLTLSADGRWLVTMQTLIDTQTGKDLWHNDELLASRAFPDGQLLGMRRNPHRGELELVDLKNRNVLAALPDWCGEPDVSAFSPDGRWFFAAISSQEADCWDLQTRQRVWQLDLPPNEVCELRPAFASDGRHVVIATYDRTDGGLTGRIRVLTLPEGRLVWSRDVPGDAPSRPIVTPDGRYAAVRWQISGEMAVWELESGRDVSPKPAQ